MRLVATTAMLAALLFATPASIRAQANGATIQKYPDVVAVDVRSRSGERFDFDVTVSSPYDTPTRYADAFKVSAKDGTVFGERKLLHDHADEQPITRDLRGVRVPPGVRVVVVQARDREFGACEGSSIRVFILPSRNAA